MRAAGFGRNLTRLLRARDLYTLEVTVENNLSTEFCGVK
jgi:hypothetical protein